MDAPRAKAHRQGGDRKKKRRKGCLCFFAGKRKGGRPLSLTDGGTKGKKACVNPSSNPNMGNSTWKTIEKKGAFFLYAEVGKGKGVFYAPSNLPGGGEARYTSTTEVRKKRGDRPSYR